MTTDRDTATEEWLTSLHVTWHHEPALELSLIDAARSLTNQARIGQPLIEEAVERYTADYQRGDTFPPLLARRTSSRAKKVTLLGGNHRRAAAVAAGRTVHPAYIVECTDEAALVLAYGDNRRHGVPTSRAERVTQAVHLVEQGMAVGDAADVVGVPAAAVSRQRTVVAASRRAHDLDVGATFDALPIGHRDRLAQLRSDPVFIETIRLAADAQLGQVPLVELIGRLRKARSDDHALRLLGSTREDHAEVIQTGKALKRTGRRANPPTSYSKLNGALLTVLDTVPSDVVPPDPASVARLRSKVKDAARNLMAIDKALA